MFGPQKKDAGKNQYEPYILAVRMQVRDREVIEKLAEIENRSMSSWALNVLRNEIIKRNENDNKTD